MPEVCPPPGACRDALNVRGRRRRPPLAAAAASALFLVVSLCSAGAVSARQLPVLSVKEAGVNEGDSGVTNVPVTVGNARRDGCQVPSG